MKIENMTILGGNNQFANQFDDAYRTFLGSKEVALAWSKVNFGPQSNPIKTIGRNLVKVAYGYDIGSGAYFLLEELGLAKKGKNKIKLTEKGFEFLSLPFNRG